MAGVGAQGSAFKLYTVEEVTEGTVPGGNWDQRPCFTFTPAGNQAMEQDQVLSAGLGRSASDPFFGMVRVEGDTRIPIDTVHFGWWLKMLLGDPVTTGTGPYTHVFRDGAATLPTFSAEKAFPDIGRYEVLSGMRASSLSMNLTPSGAADATVTLMGLAEEEPAGTSAAGTPVVTQFTRFQKSQGAITKDGVALTAVTAAEMTISNQMEVVEAIRNDYRAEGVDIGQSTATGSLTLRFKDHAFKIAAMAMTPVVLEYSLTISASASLTFRFPRTFLQRPGIPVEGPLGISQQVQFITAYDTTEQCLAKVTYVNSVAEY